jgi:aldehyde dehydrogenase (NAD+)
MSESPAELVKAVRAAYDRGVTRPVEWRIEQLQRMSAMLRESERSFLGALSADLGKPSFEGYATELGFLLKELHDARANLPKWVKAKRVKAPLAVKPGHADLVPEPLGVALVIAPWNYPVQLLLAPMIGAIAAGNAVIGKPSELTPRVAELLAERVEEYLDPEAIRIVTGGVPETTALLEERFDHIFYTGNGRVGRVVMEAAAKHLTPVTLELGGKSPTIIDRSADVRTAARRIAWGKFLNSGQTCIAPDYVLVHEDLEFRFLDEMQQAIDGFFGSDPQRSADYGRVVNTHHHRRLMGLLGEGDVVIGGTGDEGDRYIAPTVLRNVALDDPVMQEEIFGPILPVIPVPDLRHAIDIVNAREKPLALYIFAEDRSAVDQVLAHTSSGGVCVNHTIMHIAVPDLPFGGVGESGMGGYHGKASFDIFTHYKPVLTKPSRPDPSVAYPPYGPVKTGILRRLMS